MIDKMKSNKGQILIQVVVFGAIAVYLLSGLVNWAAINMNAGRQAIYREQAIQIAEAGVDYYRWHLAHASQDYQDGTGVSGPYIHDFEDKDGNSIGQFTLDITPPPLGSSLVAIKSTGGVNANIATERNISVSLAKPSLAKFAVVANAAMRFVKGRKCLARFTQMGAYALMVLHTMLFQAPLPNIMTRIIRGTMSLVFIHTSMFRPAPV